MGFAYFLFEENAEYMALICSKICTTNFMTGSQDVSSRVWSGIRFSVVGSEIFTPTGGSLGSGPIGPASKVFVGTVGGVSPAMGF